MGIIGRFRQEYEEKPTDYQNGYEDGRTTAERLFCDTILFQDAYISALEREVSQLRKEVQKQRDADSDG